MCSCPSVGVPESKARGRGGVWVVYLWLSPGSRSEAEPVSGVGRPGSSLPEALGVTWTVPQTHPPGQEANSSPCVGRSSPGVGTSAFRGCSECEVLEEMGRARPCALWPKAQDSVTMIRSI